MQLGLPGGPGLADGLNEEQVTVAMAERIRSFIAENSLNPVLLSLKPYDSEEVLRWYFNGEPPFDDRKDKCQFPDAFVVSALCEWARRHSISLRVVTNDAAMASAFRHHGNHTIYESLDQALTDIAREADPLYAEAAEVIRMSEKNFRNDVAFCIGRLNLATEEPYRARITAIDELQLELDATFVSQDVPDSAFATASIGVLARVRYEVSRATEPVASTSSRSDAEYPEQAAGATTIVTRLTAQVSLPLKSKTAWLMPFSVQPESDVPIQLPLPAIS